MGAPFRFLVGQTVEITIPPEISASHPVQVTAVAIKRLPDPPGGTVRDTAAYVRADRSCDDAWDFLLSHIENADIPAIGRVQHLPVMRLYDSADRADWPTLPEIPKADLNECADTDAYIR